MATEVGADFTHIQDEDALRKLWHQTQDFARKKEIRARMYKLREQRLKEFYTTGEVISDATMATTKHSSTKHADSIADQGFLSMKSKEIRDSESPTRDIHRRLQKDNNYWNSVQESYSTSDEGGQLIETYERQLAGQGISPDGKTHTQSAAGEKTHHSSIVEVKDDSTRQEENLKQNAKAAFSSHTKTDDGGDLSISALQEEERQKASSFTSSVSGNLTSYSSSKQESSKSSNSTKQVISSSSATTSTYKILPSGERVLVSTLTTGGPGNNSITMDDNDYSKSNISNVSEIREISDRSSIKNDEAAFKEFNQDLEEKFNTKGAFTESTQLIANEKIDSINKDKVSISQSNFQTSGADMDVKLNDFSSLTGGRVTSRNESRNEMIYRSENENSNVVDQKILTELNKLDSYLSTQNTTGTTTPLSPHSVTGDASNWTVVSNSNGEFVYRSDKENKYVVGDKPEIVKHPSSLDLPKDATEGQYVTTYQQSYQPKRISVEHSPTHDAFARSLRASPPLSSSTRSSSKGSLDKTSPERKFKKTGSPSRSSPDKERRTSLAGSYTIETPKEVKRKVSEIVCTANKDSSTKSKRKFSNTQTKATSKIRSSTPGTSPTISPTRLGNNITSSSDNESDGSQLTYDKNKITSISKRKDSLKTTKTNIKTERSSSQKSLQQKSPTRSSPDTSPHRIPSARSTETSPQRKSAPRSSPETSPQRKQYSRSSPETSPQRKSASRSSPESSPQRKPSSRTTSPDKSPQRKSATYSNPETSPQQKTSNKPTSILRKDSKTLSTSIIRSESPDKNKSYVRPEPRLKSPQQSEDKKNKAKSLTQNSEITFEVNITDSVTNRKNSGTTGNIILTTNSNQVPRSKSPDYSEKTSTLKRKTSKTGLNKDDTTETFEVNINESSPGQTFFDKNISSQTVTTQDMLIQDERDDTIDTNIKTKTYGLKETSIDQNKVTEINKPKTQVDEFIKNERQPKDKQIIKEQRQSPTDIENNLENSQKHLTERVTTEETISIEKREDNLYENILNTSDKSDCLNIMKETHYSTQDNSNVTVDSFNDTKEFIQKEKSPITSPLHLGKRDKSPEYSSEGSVSREIKLSRKFSDKSKKSPDSSPERRAFKPIKSFRNISESPDHPQSTPSPISQNYPVKEITKQKHAVKPRDSSPNKPISIAEYSHEKKDMPSSKGPVKESKSKTPSPFSSPERSVRESSLSPSQKPTKISRSSASPERKRINDSTNELPEHKQQKKIKKSPEKTVEIRTTRRSSIPRADKKAVRKITETKIELKSKPATNIRVNSFDNKKTEQKSTVTRAISQGSMTKQTTTKTFKTTAVRDITPRQSPARTPSSTRIKTTAVINVSKPTGRTPTAPPNKPGSNITTFPKKTYISPVNKKTSTVSIKTDIKTTSNSNVLKERNSIKKEIKKEQKIIKSNVSHKDEYDGSSDRSTSVSSPETVRPAENINNIAINLICSKGTNIYHETFNIDEQDYTNLENEMPPDDFNIYDEEDIIETSPNKETPKISPKIKEKQPLSKQPISAPKKSFATPQQTSKTTVNLKTTSKASQISSKPTTVKRTDTKQIQSRDNLIRSSSDRSVSKTSAIKKGTTKQDSSKSLTSKISYSRNTAAKETGRSTKNIPLKSTIAKPSPKGKQPLERDTSSSSSDEETEVDIPSNISVISQDEQYINELEDIRRKEEQNYAAKLTATNIKEDSLLNIIIQHPKSSRESSPGYPNDQPFCTVSDDDGGAHPRYADLISEPEDIDVFDISDKRTPINKPLESPKQPEKIEQVTDLDEEIETEEKLNVSVADRVSQFIESSKEANTVKVSSTNKENITKTKKESPKAVLKAKHMFETIAKNQTAPPAPGNKPVDVLSRPSVFEARRGLTAPKEKIDLYSSEDALESSLEVITVTEENFDDRMNNKNYTRDTEIDTLLQPKKEKSPSPERKDTIKRKSSSPTKNEPITSSRKSPSPTRSVLRKSISPEKDVAVKKPIMPSMKPVADSTNLILSETNEQTKYKSAISHTKSNKISLKRDFFEQKAKTDESVISKGKPAVRTTPLKSRPVTTNKKVFDSRTDTISFIENEKFSSPRSSPERKLSRPASPTKKFETPISKSVVSKTISKDSDSIVTNKTETRKITADVKVNDKKARSVSPIKDKREPIRSASPTKERKEPLRSSSPIKDKAISRKQEAKESLDKEKSPERQIRKDLVRDKSPVKSSSSSTDIKRVSPERNLPSERKSSINRISPERKVSIDTKKTLEKEHIRRDSLDKTIIMQKHGDVVELNRAGRFGVTLRRTSSSSSTGTLRRTSVPGGDEIEDIYKLELLEEMLEKAVGYEQRRRIRAQIRIVKKLQEEARSARKSAKSPTKEIHPTSVGGDSKKSTTTVTEKIKTTFDTNDKKKTEAKKEIPEKRSSVTVTEEIEITKTEMRKPEYERKQSQRPVSPTKSKFESPTKSSTSETKQTKTVTLSKDTSPVRLQDVTKTESTMATSSTVRTAAREREPCPITSSYGVGPTDENGRPLFGLKALRRSNTSKTLTDEVVEQEYREQKQEVEVTQTDEIHDARGRPLFGLKALQVSSVDTQEMPEVSTHLRGLVQKHERTAREHTTIESQPRQKPKARLRDSFILDEDSVEGNEPITSTTSTTKTTTTSTRTSSSTPPQRGAVSLRSLIQKHEDISSTGGNVHHEMESKTTVVTSKSTINSDGSVSLSKDVIKGELSSKNGKEPSGKLTHTKYSYQNPDVKNKTQGISSTTTTTTSLGGRRTSGPRITEIEDCETRRSSMASETSSRRFSGTRITDFEESDSSKYSKEIDESTRRFSTGSSRRFSQDTDDGINTTPSSKFVSSAIRKFSGPKEDDISEKKSSAKFVSSTASSSVRKSNLIDSSLASSPIDSKTKTVASSLTTTTSSVQKQEDEDKKKPLIRGDSIRALQHKFQQATVSSSLKKHSPVNSDSPKSTYVKVSPTSPTSRQFVKQERSGSSNEDSTTSSRTVQSSSTCRVSSEKSSFLDNTSKVSGVQDILNRMRNADLVVETGDTNEDQEARALLNKFLGASVILQGMEQGMKANQQQYRQSNGHSSLPASPTSATLVSRVEKQRVANTGSQIQDYDELENVWDEKQLRSLLEDCSDYEGRRKIRARLRNVMAEHKACADVMAVTSDVTGNSLHSQERVESKQVSSKMEDSSYSHSEVHTRTSSSYSTSQHRITKANSVTSPFQKFRQLERQNSAPSHGSSDTPLFKFTDPKVARSASSIKDRLLSWVQAQTKEYKNIQIENFSTSWSNGLAFCALIHHFCPEAFDYDKLTPEQRRHNFELAFRVAEEEADIAPLLDVEDMVAMRRPDWKCVFTYVQSVYRRFHTTPVAVRPSTINVEN